jgi:hypothetical protein
MTHTCDQALASANATIATLILANVTDICIHAKKVRSFAKKTLGSTLSMGLIGVCHIEVVGLIGVSNIEEMGLIHRGKGDRG